MDVGPHYLTRAPLSILPMYIYTHIDDPQTQHAARPFPTADGEKDQSLVADLALRRRAEVSRLGRFLRSNGVDNAPGDALTVVMK